MGRLAIPLRHRKLWWTGDVLLRPVLELSLKTQRGTWVRVPFLVDSGTEMTCMPASEARKLDLPMPRQPVRGGTFGQANQGFRSGLIQSRIIGLGATEYVFPCFFLGDPDALPTPRDRNLLGLSGVINQVHLSFDGTTAASAPYGFLVVETI
jgi:hypothetical protein